MQVLARATTTLQPYDAMDVSQPTVSVIGPPYLDQALQHLHVAQTDCEMHRGKCKEAAPVDVSVVTLAIGNRRVAKGAKPPIVCADDDAGVEQCLAAGSRAGENGVVKAVFGVEVVEKKGVGSMGEQVGDDVRMTIFAGKHCERTFCVVLFVSECAVRTEGRLAGGVFVVEDGCKCAMGFASCLAVRGEALCHADN